VKRAAEPSKCFELCLTTDYPTADIVKPLNFFMFFYLLILKYDTRCIILISPQRKHSLMVFPFFDNNEYIQYITIMVHIACL